ncbi:cytochrome P450 2B1-like isoform X3 [Arvicola amphibius]|uniref:cytochrome P450 2B1-like isoform X3 n=1 Tax=Arvicola amphibius TaxID=1047088 RepID=UPI001C092C9B|nr:cytochrome P450 2B1-like isoform X3 [Arvicola amphibius]
MHYSLCPLSCVPVSWCPCQHLGWGEVIGREQVTDSPSRKYDAHTPGQGGDRRREQLKLLNWLEIQVQHKSPAGVCSGVDGAQTRTMEPSVLLLLALLMGFLLLLVRGHPKAHGHLPPGPRPLPILGNLLQMDRGGFLNSFMRLREKYGDVFTVHLGPRPVVMLCGTEAIREALVDQAEAFSGRGTMAVFDPVAQGYGMFFSSGERWKTLRRFSLATLKDLGMGKRSVEERIQEEALHMVEELRKSQGTPLDPTFLFHYFTANIICSIVFGERVDKKDRQFLHVLDRTYQTISLTSSFSGQMFELYSGFLKFFPGAHRQICKNMQEILDYIGHSVEKHQATLDPNNPRDFIDTYLIRMEKEKSNQHTEFHHQNLMISALSLFFAGTETSSTTLRYGFLFMLKYPHVAEKVQKEIDQVIGSHRPPTLEDRTKMPYTDAVIHEIQRFSDLVPIGVPHKVTKDTSFRGYLLPKESAFVSAKALPAMNCSFSSPPSSRTSLCPVPWLLRTLTSGPRRVA